MVPRLYSQKAFPLHFLKVLALFSSQSHVSGAGNSNRIKHQEICLLQNHPLYQRHSKPFLLCVFRLVKMREHAGYLRKEEVGKQDQQGAYMTVSQWNVCLCVQFSECTHGHIHVGEGRREYSFVIETVGNAEGLGALRTFGSHPALELIANQVIQRHGF